MKYIITLIILLILSSYVQSQELFDGVYVEEKQKEKLFEVYETEKIELDLYSLGTDIENIPFYPVLRLDFFYVFNPEYYKGKLFTTVLTETKMYNGAVLGVRLRVSVGHNK